MFVSVIMPNYNGGKYIESSILSVANQSFKNWELIIIDDKSKDDSCIRINKMIDQYSNFNIKLIKLEKNSGTPGVPRNFGLDAATGDAIAFIDSDDLWHPQKLEIQLNYMLGNDSVFSFTNVLPFFNESEINGFMADGSMLREKLKTKNINYDYLLKKNFIKSCSTALVKSDVIEGIRFNNDPNFKAVEDYMFWLDILKKNCNHAHWLDLYTTFYRESSSSISSSKLFMIKQNYKMYNYLFQKQKRKKLLVWNKIISYGFYSLKHIIVQKIKWNK